MLDCDHKIGGLYKGKLCQRVILEARHVEVSLVDEPRNRKAVVTTLTNRGRKYHVFDGTTTAIPEDDLDHDKNGMFSGYAMTYSLPYDPSDWTSLRKTIRGEIHE